MTTERDLDSALDRWMDDGPTIVADRVVAAAMTDVHTTRQRGARWALLKELFMTMKPAATIVGIAAAIVIGVAAYQYVWGGPSIGGPAEPRIVSASELPDIVLAAEDPPDDMRYDGTHRGADTLMRPIISVEGTSLEAYRDQPGFVAGRYTEFSNERAGVLSWATLFETVDDAELALSVYVSEVQSVDGYGLRTRTEVALGDEGAFYSDGDDPEFNAQVYLWRAGNLVMAAATYGDFDPDQLGQIAEGMDDRAR
jgi:hypothetical protein